MLDRGLIDQFRKTVYGYNHIFSTYINIENKNRWNCICSAMDWITVSIDYLCKHPAIKTSDFGSIEMCSLISCIDIIIEAVEQLHRVIYKNKEKVFLNDREISLGNFFDQSDRTYFKTIRSCFGAHPVNLDDPTDKHNQESKFFAGWSGGFFGKSDYSVFLYSNQVKGNDTLLGINFEQLLLFAEKYYRYCWFRSY